MQHANTLALCITLGIVGYLVGSSAVTATGPSQPNFIQRVQVEGIPTPKQMVRILEGTPFTVPDGMTLVVTGLGSNREGSGEVELLVDGIKALATRTYANDQNGTTSIRPVPPGLIATEGQTLTVIDSTSAVTAVALGYVARQ